MEKIRVLFLAASPTVSRLSLDEEIREITAKIRAAEYRDALEVISKWAVRPDDLQQALLEHQPQVLHFSGHGTQSEELVFLDSKGAPTPVSKAALTELLRVLKDNLRLVVLNACFSRPQAEAITQVIDCAVGMNRAVGDEAAIKFAAAFYGAIGFGRSIQTAFDLGRAALMLDGIPEESTPVLLVRTGVDPAREALITPPETTPVTDAAIPETADFLGILSSASEAVGAFVTQRKSTSSTAWEEVVLTLEMLAELTALHTKAVAAVTAPILSARDVTETSRRYALLVNNPDFPQGYDSVRGVLEATRSIPAFKNIEIQEKVRAVLDNLYEFQYGVFTLGWDSYHASDAIAACARLVADTKSSADQIDHASIPLIRSYRELFKGDSTDDVSSPTTTLTQLIVLLQVWCRAWQRDVQRRLYGRRGLGYAISQLRMQRFQEREQDSESRTDARGGGSGSATVGRSSTALHLWREKRAYFEEQEAIASDPAQKFALRKQIEEATAKIKQLGG